MEIAHKESATGAGGPDDALLRRAADELLTTTRSVRSAFDYGRSVPASVLEECLDVALQAPTGGNEQGWEWIFVTDGQRKRAIADAYRATMRETAPPELLELDDPAIRWIRRFVDRLHEIPVMVIPCYRGRVEELSAFYQASHWGSILPAAWSFMVALRARGLATRWTTLHLGHEREVAQVLGVPYDEITQACMFPIAYTTGTPHVRGQRLLVDSHLHWNRWDEHQPG